MRMIRREQLFYSFFSQLFILVRDQGCKINERYVLRLCDFSGPYSEVSGPAFDPAVVPNVSHRQGHDKRRRALGFRISDHLPHVPSVAVHNLVLLCQQVVDLLSLLSDAGKRAAGSRCIVDCARVIMAKLNQDKIAPLHLAQNLIPKAFGDKSSAAASSTRSIENIDLFSVKVAYERIAPPLRAICIVVCGRVTDHEKRRQVRIDWSLFSRARLLTITRALSLSPPGRNTQHYIN